MAKVRGLPLGTFLKRFSTKAQCQEHLASLRWRSGYACPKCGCRHGYRLSNGRYQCARCRYQTSVTARTVRIAALSAKQRLALQRIVDDFLSAFD